MNNEQINQFDSTLKESTANFELPFNDAAWNLMDKKLNKEFGNSSKRRFLFWLLPTIAIAIAGVFVYQHKANTNSKNIVEVKGNEANAEKNNVIKQQEIVNNLNQKNNEEKNINNLKSNNNANELNFNKKDNNVKNEVEINNEVKNNSEQNNDKKEIFISNKISNNKKENNRTSNNEAMSLTKIKTTANNDNTVEKENKSDLGNINAASQSLTNNSKKSNSVAEVSTIKTLETIESNNAAEIYKRVAHNYSASQMHNRFLPKFKLAELEASKILKPDMSLYYTKPIKLLTVYPEIPLPNRWYIGGSLAGNISYSSNPRIADLKMGYNLYIGINVNNQVSFQTGFSYGNKQFDLKKNQFIYSGDNLLWEKYIRASYVNVDVLDIPFTVRYQFSEKPNTGLFCTAGISSLFFNKENYTLDLDWGSGTPDYHAWNFDNGQSLFSMFNASVGYQFPINKYYTITAEQTIQLPTRNIGGAAMRMSSTGFQIGVKYNLIGKKK